MDFVVPLAALGILGVGVSRAKNLSENWIPPNATSREIGNIRQYVETSTDVSNPLRLTINPYYAPTEYSLVGPFGVPRNVDFTRSGHAIDSYRFGWMWEKGY